MLQFSVLFVFLIEGNSDLSCYQAFVTNLQNSVAGFYWETLCSFWAVPLNSDKQLQIHGQPLLSVPIASQSESQLGAKVFSVFSGHALLLEICTDLYMFEMC